MFFSHECLLRVELGKVRAFFSNPSNLLKITPLSFLMGIKPAQELREGLRIELSFLGFSLMESLIRDVEAFGFTDIAIKKPPFIKHWEHRHRFIPRGTSTVIEDLLIVDTTLPNFLMKSLLWLMFKYRCRKLKKLLE